MRFCGRSGCLLLVVAFLTTGAWTPACGDAPARRQLRIAAASDLKFAMDELVGEFARQRPEVRIIVSYGSSGTFFAQISNRAPFDMFFSADLDYPRALVKAGLADAESEFAYAAGRIVVWTRSDAKWDVRRRGIEALRDPAVRKIALASPRHAPYGRAAEQALRNLGLWEQVKERLVFGENVAQAAQFVESGAADAGIIALSLALAPSMQAQGQFWLIPPDAHAPLEQGGVITRWCADREAAQAFRDYVISDSARSIFRRFGFVLPTETPEPSTLPEAVHSKLEN